VETPAAGGSATEGEPDNSLAAAARAISQLSIPDPSRHEVADIVIQAVDRLRDLLHQGDQLKAYYFSDLFQGRQAVTREFWATPKADGVLESGNYFPFGRPSTWHERRPVYPLCLLQAELDELLSEPQAAKRPFPEAKKPELVAALRKLNDLPNRRAQRKAVCDLPEFRQYHITDAVFREAASKAPRRPGRAAKRQRD
jgi:hypothetical protein